MEAEPGGLLLIVSHFGNIELLRAGLSPALRARLTAFVHSDNAVQFNRVLARFQPNAALNTIQVTDVGPDTMLDLKQRVDNGEWIAIAATKIGATFLFSRHPRSALIIFDPKVLLDPFSSLVVFIVSLILIHSIPICVLCLLSNVPPATEGIGGEGDMILTKGINNHSVSQLRGS